MATPRTYGTNDVRPSATGTALQAGSADETTKVYVGAGNGTFNKTSTQMAREQAQAAKENKEKKPPVVYADLCLHL